MSAPIRFVAVDKGTGRILVQVGKSDHLREVEMTDHERLQLLSRLAQWAEMSL